MGIITPWEVKGSIDYDKVVKDFGVSRITPELVDRIKKLTGKEPHFYLKRNVFFAHRDLKFVLDEYEKGNKFFLYTGRAPSGKVHIGHLVPLLFTKWLQDAFDVELWFQFPDEEKFLFKKDLSWEDSQKYLEDNMLDVIALGFNPKKTFFLVDSRHAGLMYKHGVMVAKKINFSTVKSAFGFDNEQNIGAIFYTAMQAVPAFLPSVIKKKNVPCLIPHAVDQDPHFRVSRDVIPKLGFYKPASIQCRFLPGLKGMDSDGKMSSSAKDISAVFTTDDANTVKKKILKYAFSGGRDTVEEHREKGGDPDIDVSYLWLTFFEEDDEKLRKIYHDYKSGKLLSGELKMVLVDKINGFLAEHQKKRKESEKIVDKFIYKG